MEINHLQSMNDYYQFLAKLEQTQSIHEIVSLLEQMPKDLKDSEANKIESIAKTFMDNIVENMQSY
jgi:hypothetical protein